MQIIKGIAIVAVLIIAGLLALIVAAYLAFRIAAAIFEQQESWKDSGSRKGRERGEKMRNFRLDDESGHQEALFSWAAYRTGLMPELQYMYHVPNGGKRDKATAAVLKRQGVKAGVPDIMLPAARAGYHGLYIELKAGENTTTKKQKEWLEYLRQQGYYTAVCYGWQPAAQLIEQYLLHSDELTKEQETVTMR